MYPLCLSTQNQRQHIFAPLQHSIFKFVRLSGNGSSKTAQVSGEVSGRKQFKVEFVGGWVLGSKYKGTRKEVREVDAFAFRAHFGD